MALRRPKSTKSPNGDHHKHDDHSHTHSLFSHTHDHDGDGHHDEAEKIMAAWSGAADRGSRITLIGLFANVGLTLAKGVAGWFLHSASLLADAGHSLSDLLGDFVTLFCWKLSRKPPSERYPYGFAKFETLGTTTVSLLLIGGALGIGFHSYHLLITALSETASTMPTGPLQHILENVTSVAPPAPQVVIQHSHTEIVDPNAAWIAAISVVLKEWLYRITKNVADDEKSTVLLANAIHHRSDAYSSLVALFAILGSWFFPSVPLDPIGGFLVSLVILQQGFGLLGGAWGDLTDAGVSAKTRQSIHQVLQPLITSSPSLDKISHIRGRRSGSLLYVDLVVSVPGRLTVTQAATLEEEIAETLQKQKKEVAEVRVKFVPT